MDDDLIELFANALAVYYAPHNEDYGYVTLEAMASGTPVLTAHDSGGVLEFVRHEENGLVVDPDSDSVGHAVNRLVDDASFAEKMGANGRAWIEKSGLDSSTGWDKIVDNLLSPIS